MPDSVARLDDGVHWFFTRCAERIATTVLAPGLLERLGSIFRGKRRARRFRLPTMIWLGLFAAAHAAERSMEQILAKARDALETTTLLPLDPETLSQSGWSRAKARLPLGLLRRLWRHGVALARERAGDAAWFHGLRLVALDKKTLTVPEALWPTFGSHKGRQGHGPAQGELMVAYDVCVRVPLGMTLARVNTKEYVLAPRVIRSLRCASLLLIDAGFYSIGLFAEVLRGGHQFLSRMPSNCKPELIKRLGPNDGLYAIRAAYWYWKDKDPRVPERLRVRVVRVQWKGFRPVRLVTSLLDPREFPVAELADLYHRRWHIETFFRELSGDVEFEHWHTRRLKVLYVELLFVMLYVTVVRAHMAEAATAAGLLPGALSFARGADACVRAWSRIGKSPSHRHQAILDELHSYVATLKIDVRPGRRFERKKQKRRAQSRQKKLQTLRRQKHAA
jgi:hypothetical protein